MNRRLFVIIIFESYFKDCITSPDASFFFVHPSSYCLTDDRQLYCTWDGPDGTYKELDDDDARECDGTCKDDDDCEYWYCDNAVWFCIGFSVVLDAVWFCVVLGAVWFCIILNAVWFCVVLGVVWFCIILNALWFCVVLDAVC